MLKLFGLKEMDGSELLIPGLFFFKKEDAKKERVKRNKRDEKGQEIFNFVVTRGPDHMYGTSRHSSYRQSSGPKGSKRGTKLKVFEK